MTRPEVVLRYHGASLQSLREFHHHFIVLSSQPFVALSSFQRSELTLLLWHQWLHKDQEKMSFRNHIITKHGDLLKVKQNEGKVEEINNNSSGSDMDGEINQDNDFAPLTTIDFQRESEEIRCTGALHLLKMKDKDRVSQAGIDSFVENTISIVRTSVEILELGLITDWIQPVKIFLPRNKPL